MEVSLAESAGGKDIASIIRSISLLETVVDDGDATYVRLVHALRSAMFRGGPASKPDATVAPAGDGVMRLYRLLKKPLADRLDLALAAARLEMTGRSGSVELVAIKSPDTVELQCIGSSHEGIERAIRQYCPEIQRIQHRAIGLRA